MKHDELLELEKKLRASYIESSEALDDPGKLEGSEIAFYQKRLSEIEAEAKKHQGEQCEEAKELRKYGPDKCNAHDFNPEHWLFEQKIQEKMQENDFTKRFWSHFARDGDPMVDVEEPSFYWVETIEELKKAFMMYDAYRDRKSVV